MEQPWDQQQREGGGYAMGESSCHADLDQAAMTTDRLEVDGALLMMELMEDDLPPSDLLLLDGDVDDRQLSHVIRSLEAEIGADEPAVMMADDGGVQSLRKIEDVFSDDNHMDVYDYEGASSSFLAGHDESEGWCVYTDNGYDTMVVDHQYYYCCAEGSADHMYLPLWE